MAGYVHGSAPGVAVGPAGGARTFFHRYELVGDVLVRRRVGDRRPFLKGEARIVDVLLSVDETGRRLDVVRGIRVSEGDLARLDRAAVPSPWHEFAIGEDLMTAIHDDLDIGPRARPKPRLATLDGRPVGQHRRGTCRNDEEMR